MDHTLKTTALQRTRIREDIVLLSCRNSDDTQCVYIRRIRNLHVKRFSARNVFDVIRMKRKMLMKFN
jgi:hypothetical protein